MGKSQAGGPEPGLPEVAVLVNQVGYEAVGPKRVVLQCRRKPQAEPGRFSVIQEGTRQVLYAGGWEPFGRVNAGTKDDWGFHYWRGEFGELERAGRVFIETEVEGRTWRSAGFEIGRGVLWKRLAPLLVECFRRSRNTTRNGILEGEERYYEVSGAWFTLGSRGGTVMRDAWKVLWALCQTRERNPFLDEAREELLYGSQWWKRIMIHYPRSGRIISGMGGWRSDNGRIAWYDYPEGEKQHEKLMSLALYAMLFGHLRDSGFLKRAEKMWDFYRDWITTDRIFAVFLESLGKADTPDPSVRNSWPPPGRNFTLVDDAAFLFGDIEMFHWVKQRPYLEHARELVDRLLAEAQDPERRRLLWNNFADHLHVTSLAYFARRFPDDPRSEAIARELESFFDELTSDAEGASPFGIGRKNFAGPEAWRPRGRLRHLHVGFFDPRPEGTGLNLTYGMEAWQALWVHRLVPKDRYRRYAQAHIDWVLGLNPRGLCMVKGVGAASAPMTPEDAPEGSVCYGLTSDGSRDRPWLGPWPGAEAAGEEARLLGGHPPQAQCEVRLGAAASLLLALSMT